MDPSSFIQIFSEHLCYIYTLGLQNEGEKKSYLLSHLAPFFLFFQSSIWKDAVYILTASYLLHDNSLTYHNLALPKHSDENCFYALRPCTCNVQFLSALLRLLTLLTITFLTIPDTLLPWIPPNFLASSPQSSLAIKIGFSKEFYL